MKDFKGMPGTFKIDTNPATHIMGLKTVEISTTRAKGSLPEWVAYVRGNNFPEALATAKLFAASKDMVEALQELLRFHMVMTEAADELQYPDNFLKAIEAAKAALSKALD